MNKKIRDLETLNNLILYTSDIYFFISAENRVYESIQEKRRALFTDNYGNLNIIWSLFDDVLSKYLTMSFNQFIRKCNQRFAEKGKSTGKTTHAEKDVVQKKTWSIEKCISVKNKPKQDNFHNR